MYRLSATASYISLFHASHAVLLYAEQPEWLYELEDFEADHLDSDCYLKEEPSLYWKVWPIGH